MNTAILSGRELSYQYNRSQRQPEGGKAALANLSFDLFPGQFLALLGPNGAGKSTLFALLTQLLRLQQGDILVDGTSIRQARSAALKSMGVVFQQSTLDPDLTVIQNLNYYAALHGMSSREARARSLVELERLQLGDAAGKKIRHLNGGHQRRVEIARALLHRPRLLLLDEATAGLDLETRANINRHVRDLCQQQGIAVLWATHLIDEVEAADQVMILHRGNKLAQNRCEELLLEHHCDRLIDLFGRLTGTQTGELTT